jgi:hypothetical protein
MLLRTLIATVWIAGLLSWSSSASAQADVDRASAEALFNEGRRLMAEGAVAQACPKLEASQRLDPGVGTLLNLADCYAKLGRTASAWAAFREAGSMARAAGSAEREAVARERATALEAKLSYLTIVQWKGQNVRVTRNGVAIDPAMLDTAMPVDPGEHVIVAAAEGKREWSTKVVVAPDGQRASVTIPILPDDLAGGGGDPEGATSVALNPTSEDAPGGSTQRWLAVGAGAVGVIGLVTGVVFGLKASSQNDEAKACNAEPSCGEAGTLSHDAGTSADIATIAFVIGGVGIAGGLVLWLTAPDDDVAGPEDVAGRSLGIGLGLQGISVHGRL